jgi:uncharacterized damage-inducible protein DinB
MSAVEKKSDDSITLLGGVFRLVTYSDWAIEQLVCAAEPLSDKQLDNALDMGMGSLRRTLLHIVDGENVWLQRCMGRAETRWRDYDERVSPSELRRQHRNIGNERERFLNALSATELDRFIVYRDSKGQRFQAMLCDMIFQMLFHSAHHRAQAVNMIRRVGGAPPELDYMYYIRIPE